VLCFTVHGLIFYVAAGGTAATLATRKPPEIILLLLFPRVIIVHMHVLLLPLPLLLLLLLWCQQHVQALACYQEAMRLRPGYADALAGMGAVLKELRMRPEAAAAFEAVTVLRPCCALAHGNLAGALYDMGALEQAISSYRTALALEPSFAEAVRHASAAPPQSSALCTHVCAYLLLLQAHGAVSHGCVILHYCNNFFHMNDKTCAPHCIFCCTSVSDTAQQPGQRAA
jgi:tetratricopeptide (TPR) repeat protein